MIPLTNPEEGGQPSLWMRDSHDIAGSFLKHAIHLPVHRADANKHLNTVKLTYSFYFIPHQNHHFTTCKVHTTFNFPDSTKFCILITLPRHASITRLKYFTYIFISERELVFSSQRNLDESEITSTVQYLHCIYLKLIKK